MSRTPLAILAGVAGLIAYVAAAVVLADEIPSHWAVQALYFAVAGLVWMLPIYWLMLWSLRK